MHAFLKALHFIALCCALGAPVWWLGVWQVLDSPTRAHLAGQVWRRVSRFMLYGTVCLVVSGLADALRAASQVIDPAALAEYWQFLIATRYGQMALVKACLAPALYGCFVLLRPRWQRLGLLGTGLCGAALLLSFCFAGHAAAKPGLVPLVTDAVHLLGAVLWGGGLFYLALLPWNTLRHETGFTGRVLRVLLARFSTLALLAVLLLVSSGAILAFLQVYGLVALTETLYGRTLLLKVSLLLLALCLAGWQLIRLSPALQRQERRGVPAVVHTLVGRCAGLIRAETVLILGALACAGVLTTLPPADRPAQVTPVTWDTAVGDWRLTMTMRPIDEAGQVHFGMILVDSQGQAVPDDVPLSVHLRMRDHEMGTFSRTASTIAPGHYTTQGLVSMAGTWEVGVAIQPPGAKVQTALVTFDAITGALDQDRERRLDLAAAVVSPVALVSCILGLLFGVLAVVTLWASQRGRLPVWGTPFGFGLMLCAGYLILRVVLVDAYPTTYSKNPLPSSAAAMARGQQVFQEHCTICHGSRGHGDGPAAAGLQPAPADLTAAHVDDHTDGTLFWWITHGMGGTAMPAWEDTLSETERWAVIHYIRSLRSDRS